MVLPVAPLLLRKCAYQLRFACRTLVWCALLYLCVGFVVMWLSRHSPRPEASKLKEEVEGHNNQRAGDVLEAILILNKLSARGSSGTVVWCESALEMAV